MVPRQLILTGLILCLTVLQILVLVALALFPYIPDPALTGLNMDIYMMLAPLSPLFLLGLLYAWLLRIGMRDARNRSSSFRFFVRFLSKPFVHLVSSVKTTSLSESANTLRILSHPRLMLGTSLVVSVLLAFVAYRSDLNPTGNLVGIDSPLYVDWINQMLQRPELQALQYSFVEGLEGSRPLVLIVFYTVASLGVSPPQVVEYSPLVLAPLLALSSYVFVRFGQGTPGLAGLTALFTPLSFYVTIGMWGGYYANWMALVEVYFFLTCLLIFSKSPSALKYGSMLALSVALFLTHPWTWVLTITVCSTFGVSLWRDTRSLIHVKSVMGIVATGIILDFLKSWAFATRTVATDLATKARMGIGSSVGFWNNLVDGVLHTHGGLLGNWIILGFWTVGCLCARVQRSV